MNIKYLICFLFTSGTVLLSAQWQRTYTGGWPNTETITSFHLNEADSTLYLRGGQYRANDGEAAFYVEVEKETGRSIEKRLFFPSKDYFLSLTKVFPKWNRAIMFEWYQGPGPDTVRQYCFDFESGKRLWVHDSFSYSAAHPPYIIDEDTVFWSAYHEKLRLTNLNSGKVIHNLEVLDFIPEELKDSNLADWRMSQYLLKGDSLLLHYQSRATFKSSLDRQNRNFILILHQKTLTQLGSRYYETRGIPETIEIKQADDFYYVDIDINNSPQNLQAKGIILNLHNWKGSLKNRVFFHRSIKSSQSIKLYIDQGKVLVHRLYDDAEGIGGSHLICFNEENKRLYDIKGRIYGRGYRLNHIVFDNGDLYGANNGELIHIGDDGNHLYFREPGFNTLPEVSLFDVYPNPTRGRVTVNIPNFETSHNPILRVFKLDGKLMFERALNYDFQEINLIEALDPGLYMFRIDADNRTGETKRISLIR